MSAELVSYSQAAILVSNHAKAIQNRRPPTEELEIALAIGRILAQPVVADRDMPSFARSTRDGFACRAVEASEHRLLHVAGSSRAGDRPAGPLPEGTAWEIMTGAAVPQGADAVAMLEHVETTGETVRLAASRSLESGENVVPMGAEARSGAELIAAGAQLGPSHIAAAASCGYAAVEVFRRPRAAILTTGDELVPMAAVPAPGQIRNSNAAMLASLVAQAGGEPLVLPSAKDNPASLDQALHKALDADLLLISGGVSAGKFDLVEPALARRGAQFHFTGVRIQPGKPLVFGELPAKDGAPALPFFGLPGNPISSAATFLLFAAPMLRALGGASAVSPRFLMAQLSRNVKGKPGLTRFVPSFFNDSLDEDELPQAAPVPWQGSGDLAAFARANCFLAVPEGVDELDTGELVRVLPF